MPSQVRQSDLEVTQAGKNLLKTFDTLCDALEEGPIDTPNLKCVFLILTQAFPEDEWLPWMFPSVPDGFWRRKETIDRFFSYLARKKKLSKFSDFYKLQPQDFRECGGSSLLTLLHKDSVLNLLRNSYPSFLWLPWEQKRIQRMFWQDEAHRSAFLDHVLRVHGTARFADLYRISVRDFQEWNGSSFLLKYYGDSPHRAYTSQYRCFGWLPWKFCRAPRVLFDSRFCF